jgi:hypothetical protein
MSSKACSTSMVLVSERDEMHTCTTPIISACWMAALCAASPTGAVHGASCNVPCDRCCYLATLTVVWCCVERTSKHIHDAPNACCAVECSCWRLRATGLGCKPSSC